MNKVFGILLIGLLMSVMSFPSWGLTMADLVKRAELYYGKFTVVPFTGHVDGEAQGYIKNGRKDGYQVYYFSDDCWTEEGIARGLIQVR